MNHKHGLWKHPLYRVWTNMKTRCYNTNTHNFSSYGGKGIVVCDEWKNDFESFYKWAFQSGYIEGFTIDRITNDGIYEPSNCRWVPRGFQARNKTNNHLIQLGECTRCLAEWCLIFNLKYNTVEQRINEYGWDEVRALITPVVNGGGSNVQNSKIL